MHKRHRQESVVYRGVDVERLPFALREMEKIPNTFIFKVKDKLAAIFITINLHFSATITLKSLQVLTMKQVLTY